MLKRWVGVIFPNTWFPHILSKHCCYMSSNLQQCLVSTEKFHLAPVFYATFTVLSVFLTSFTYSQTENTIWIILWQPHWSLRLAFFCTGIMCCVSHQEPYNILIKSTRKSRICRETSSSTCCFFSNNMV